MDQRGFITNPNWFLSLPRLYVKRFLRELVDVWEYRAQIDHETKRRINPQHGNPFLDLIYMFFYINHMKYYKKSIRPYRNFCNKR